MWTAVILICATNAGTGIITECTTRSSNQEFFQTERACRQNINELMLDPVVRKLAADPNVPIVIKETWCVEWNTNVGQQEL